MRKIIGCFFGKVKCFPGGKMIVKTAVPGIRIVPLPNVKSETNLRFFSHIQYERSQQNFPIKGRKKVGARSGYTTNTSHHLYGNVATTWRQSRGNVAGTFLSVDNNVPATATFSSGMLQKQLRKGASCRHI